MQPHIFTKLKRKSQNSSSIEKSSIYKPKKGNKTRAQVWFFDQIIGHCEQWRLYAKKWQITLRRQTRDDGYRAWINNRKTLGKKGWKYNTKNKWGTQRYKYVFCCRGARHDGAAFFHIFLRCITNHQHIQYSMCWMCSISYSGSYINIPAVSTVWLTRQKQLKILLRSCSTSYWFN